MGAVCRAMKNFGLSRLRLVEPEFEGEDGVIRARAIHAAELWENAECFDSLDEAVKDCNLVIGTTRRRGKNRKQVSMSPWEIAAFLEARPLAAGPAAIVFGNERTGLVDEEIKLCNIASHIPVDETFPSLNLSHAVSIYAYEIFKTMDPQKGTVKGQWLPLNQQTIETLVWEISENFASLGFYKQAGREEQECFFRDIFSRACITKREGEYFSSLINRAVRLVEKAHDI